MNLRVILPPGIITLALCLSGCATASRSLPLAAVGPAAGASAVPSADLGTLIVFSAADATPPPPGTRSYYQRHSDYTVVSADRSLNRTILNQAGAYPGDPATVSLPPGRYQVSAHANGYGQVLVPVVIVAGRTTSVNLEGGKQPSVGENPTGENAVRMPDGTVVGWKAS